MTVRQGLPKGKKKVKTYSGLYWTHTILRKIVICLTLNVCRNEQIDGEVILLFS